LFNTAEMSFEGIELISFDTFGIEPSGSYSFVRDLRRAKAASLAEADRAARRLREDGESQLVDFLFYWVDSRSDMCQFQFANT
jgi:hypothetical protein